MESDENIDVAAILNSDNPKNEHSNQISANDEFEDIYSSNNNNNNNHHYIEPEKSIYELDNNNTESSNGDNKNSQTHNYTYSAADKKLCFIGNDADSLPTDIIYQFGLKTLILDISFNYINDLRDLVQFPYLEELICDNNLISEKSEFPKLENLKLFSCNKNKIEDIHVFTDKVKALFPKITYLSMLGNTACPNQLIDMSKDEYDYSRYRKYVLHRLRTLKFLDCYEVTAQEREMVSQDNLFFDVVKLNVSSLPNDSPELDYQYSPLPNQKSEEAEQNVTPQGAFGYCRYVYYGKQSEGNRFIKNDDL